MLLGTIRKRELQGKMMEICSQKDKGDNDPIQDDQECSPR